jgi:hypothetical protein
MVQSASILDFRHSALPRAAGPLWAGGLASLGQCEASPWDFVCGPHRPGVPRESASPERLASPWGTPATRGPTALRSPPLALGAPLGGVGVGDFVGSGLDDLGLKHKIKIP